ncbi:MAG: cation:proton antiporter [Planctomycetota bacterium]|nr:cation:proton antiporter [Planctomycetota bacterium]
MEHASTMVFWTVLGDIVILLGAAALLGMLFERVGMSAIIGSLVAGVLVGPGIFNLIGTAPEMMERAAEIGVALLLFTIGLEMSRKRLLAFGMQGVKAGILQMSFTMAAAMVIIMAWGLDWRASIAVGAMVALSSTASVARVLTDRSELDSEHGRISMAVLIVQDLAIVPLMLVVSFLGERAELGGLADQISGTAMGLVVFIGSFVLAGLLLLPRLFRSTARTGNHDLPVVLALVTCLLACWVAWRLGLSPALGAFVAGLVLADSPFAKQIRSDVVAFKAVFLTLFFASIGMLADIPWLLTGSNLLFVLGISMAIVVGKMIMTGGVVRMLGVAPRTSIATGLSLAQIGEFSFVIGAVAVGNALISHDVFQILTSASLVSLLLVPLLAGHARNISTSLERVLLRIGVVRQAAMDPATAEELHDHVIVIGAGPAGQGVIRCLRERGLEPLVIELNPRTVQTLRTWDLRAILGNATRPDILMHAGVPSARAVIVTLPDTHASVLVIEQVRNLAANLQIIARARYNIHVGLLEDAGADMIVNEEDRVGDAMGVIAVEGLESTATETP